MTGDSDHSMQDDTGFVRVERRPGPTPAGGAYSLAYYAEDGTIVEIVEYDAEGRAVARTYGEWQEMKRPSIVLHADAADADWIKRGTWDIPATNVDELREWLMGQHINASDFKQLEVYRAHVGRPDYDWLRDL